MEIVVRQIRSSEIFTLPNLSFISVQLPNSFIYNGVGGVIVGMLASIVKDRGLEPWSGQTKDLYNWYLLLLHIVCNKSKDFGLGIWIICPSGATCLPTTSL